MLPTNASRLGSFSTRHLRTLAAWLVAACAFLLFTRSALAADPKTPPTYVVPFASDDAEDNADAFTGAFRARVRSTPGWSLGETADTLELYTTALKCPEHPDAPCLERIAGALKTDRFFWGYVKKTKPGEVLAEIHFWRKAQGDTITAQTFSDNLKDQNDEVLRRLAEHAFAKLIGEVVPALVNVHVKPAAPDAVVLVDGAEVASFDQGSAAVELKPGPHTVAVRAKGYKTWQAKVDIDPGKEETLDAKLDTGTDDFAPPSKPLSGRKILGISSLVVGGGLAIAGVIETVNFYSLKSQNDDDAKNVPTTNFCDGGHPTQCSTLNQAKTARILSVVFYGASAVLLGTGAVLLLTDHSGDDAAPPQTAKRWKLEPDVGPKGASVDFSLRF
ncbi:MAG TPA: PEGA domain-containing protein [Polyangiaceae bacterium]